MQWMALKTYFFLNKRFKHPVHNIHEISDSTSLLKRTLGTCHSLSRYDGKLTGDPLDVKMFEATKWSFIDEQLPASPHSFEQMTPIVRQPNGLEIAIIKQFTFSSSLLRMSVLCKTQNSDHLEVYAKGAPEKLFDLCRPQTSIFSNSCLYLLFIYFFSST